jgi:hypothetical protein
MTTALSDSFRPTQPNDDGVNVKFDALHAAMIDELCLLRRDLDIIRNSGFKVEPGPFFNDTDECLAATEALKKRLMGKLAVCTSPSPLVFTLNTHNGSNNPAANDVSVTETVS